VREKDGCDGEVGEENKTHLTQTGGRREKKAKDYGKHDTTLSS